MYLYNIAHINKKKYLSLYQIGGNISTARKLFDSLFNNTKRKQELIEFVEVINKDNYLKKIIKKNDPLFNNFNIDNIQNFKDILFCILAESLKGNKDINTCTTNTVVDKDKFTDTYIDWVTKNYIVGKIGLIEDMYKVRELIEDYIELKNDKKSFVGQDEYLNKGLENIPGVKNYKDPSDKQGLYYIIEKYESALKDIKEKKENKNKISEEHKKIRELGENPEALELDTKEMIIYAPKTVDESRYYGCNTKWCTASAGNNRFEEYNSNGQLYIIQPKHKKYPEEKYQLHFEEKQYMNEKDQNVEIDELKKRFSTDKVFLMWLRMNLPYLFENIEDYDNYLAMDEKDRNDIKKIINGNEYFYMPLESMVFPKNIKEMTFGIAFDEPILAGQLPENLIKLTFGQSFNQQIEPGTLPKNLKELIFGVNFNQEILPGILPLNLEKLVFGHSFNQPLSPGVLPQNLKELIFDYEFNQPILQGVLPENLEKLNFGVKFNQKIEQGVLPVNLVKLTFDNMFNQTIMKDVLPQNLKELTFGHNFNQPIDYGTLPQNLKKITFATNYKQPLVVLKEVSILPPNLEKLEINKSYEHLKDLEKYIDKSKIKLSGF